jgi:hypothetical protein
MIRLIQDLNEKEEGQHTLKKRHPPSQKTPGGFLGDVSNPADKLLKSLWPSA